MIITIIDGKDGKRRVLESQELLFVVGKYLDSKSLARICTVSIMWNAIFSADYLWHMRCEEMGFQSTSGATRTRNKKPWKSVFERNLCMECFGSGKRGGKLISSNSIKRREYSS